MFKKILNCIEENIIIIVCVVALIVVGFYSLNFTSLLSDSRKEFLSFTLKLSMDNDDWGTFGDYIGGVLNPLIAGFVFYYVVKTYELQKIETKRQIEIAAITAVINTKLIQLQDLNNNIEKILKKKELKSTELHFQGNKQSYQQYCNSIDNEASPFNESKKDLDRDIEKLQNKLDSYLPNF